MAPPRRPLGPDDETPPDAPRAFRERAASAAEIEEATFRGTKRAIVETGSTFLKPPRATSTPPALAWVETRIGRFVTRTLIPHMLTAAIAGAGAWAWHDCSARFGNSSASKP